MSNAINIIFRKQADSLFDDLAMSLGVKMTFFTSSLEAVNRGKHNNLSTYCSLVQRSLGKEDICHEEDRIRCYEAKTKGGFNSYTCHAGLREVVVPVILEDTILGYALMGQIRGNDSPPSDMIKISEKCLGSGQSLIQAYEKLPLFSPDQFDHSVSLFHHVVNYMVEKNMVILRSNLFVERAMVYMKEHLEENITLSQTAEFTGRSLSSLSRHFKMQLGLSFKEVLLDMKFSRAEQLFVSSPHLAISEISDSLGFSEPAYFSRIYKKYRGISPREALKKFQKNQDPY